MKLLIKQYDNTLFETEISESEAEKIILSIAPKQTRKPYDFTVGTLNTNNLIIDKATGSFVVKPNIESAIESYYGGTNPLD